jgi:hypothetical protein
LNGELADAADTDDERRSSDGDELASAAHSAIRRDSSVCERCGGYGLEPVERNQISPRGHEDTLGVAAVALEPRLNEPRTELLLTGLAEAAAAAAPSGVDQDRTQLVVLARDLMAEHEGELAVFFLDHVQVGVAYAAADNP